MSMSENMATETTKTVSFEKRILDIYVSAESLCVYDKPWKEGDSTGAAVDNEYSEVAGASEEKKACGVRAVLLGLLVFLLLVGITGLGIKLKEEKIKWHNERKQLVADNVNLTNKLREEMDQIQEKLCEQMGCTTFWTRLHCSCYFSNCSEVRKNWKESQEHCERNEAHLVTVTTREEQEFVSTLATNNKAWMGLKLGDEGVWKWVDGTPLTTESVWSDLQHGDDRRPEEDCALVDNTEHAARWRPFTCESKHTWICEKRIE